MINYNELCKAIPKKFCVIEDNVGELTLVIFNNDNEIEYIETDFQYDPGSLVSVLEKLSYGDDLSDSEENLLDNPFEVSFVENPKRLESWFPEEQYKTGWEIIADNDGIYPQKIWEPLDALSLELKKNEMR